MTPTDVGLGKHLGRIVVDGNAPDHELLTSFWAAVYDDVAPTYDQWQTTLADDLVEYAALGEGLRILDVGCGTGLATKAAAAVVGPTGSVLGIDISPEMLEIARRSRAAANIEYRIMDVGAIDLAPASVDVAISSLSIFFLPDPIGALRQLRKVLAPHGRVVMSLFHDALPEAAIIDYLLAALPPRTLDGMRMLDSTFCQSALEQAGFGNLQCAIREYHRPPGIHHSLIDFTPAMIDFITTVSEQWAPLPAVKAAEDSGVVRFRFCSAELGATRSDGLQAGQ